MLGKTSGQPEQHRTRSNIFKTRHGLQINKHFFVDLKEVHFIFIFLLVFNSCSPLFILQFESPLRTMFAEAVPSLLASHWRTIFLQSSTLVECLGESWEPLETDIPFNAIFWAAFDIAFWQSWSQHSLTLSIFWQAESSLEDSTMLSNASMVTTGQEASVRFAGWIEQICWSLGFAPLHVRIFSTSERQCLEWVKFKASIPEYLLNCPTRVTKLAKNWGQQTTLAKYGAKEAQQSVAVTLSKLSTAEKFNVQSPERKKYGINYYAIVKEHWWLARQISCEFVVANAFEYLLYLSRVEEPNSIITRTIVERLWKIKDFLRAYFVKENGSIFL